MIDFLNNIDNQFFLFLNGIHLDAVDQAVMLFSSRFIWIPMYSTIIFILLRVYSLKQAAIYLVAVSLAILLTDQTCASLIRPVVERLRPSNLDNPISEFTHIVDGYRGGKYGFPSCHAANSFALAVFLSSLIKRYRFTIFILGWSFLNSYSRIYLGVHYPGDLIVGGLIGSVIGWLTYYSASRFDRTPRSVSDEKMNEELLMRFPIGFSLSGSVIRINTRPVVVTDIMFYVFSLTVFVIIIVSLFM